LSFALHVVKMVKRVCRDCPIPGCGAKYLVRLANHLADVHLLDCDQRRQYLQEAKLQPKVKYAVYQNRTDINVKPAMKEEQVYEISQPKEYRVMKVIKTKLKQNKRKCTKKYKKRRMNMR